MVRIFFLHNTPMWYRIPFFKKLSTIYDMEFIFTNIDVSKCVYGREVQDEILELNEVNYKIYSKKFLFPSFDLVHDLLNNNYDILVDSLESVQALLSFSISRLRRKPILFWSEEWDWNNQKSFDILLKVKSIFKRFIITHSEALIVPGTRHKNYFISLGVSPEKIFIVPNVSNISIKNEDYEKKETIKQDLHTDNKKVILYVGRLVQRKGVEYLIKAFAKILSERNDVILIIIGRGELKDKLELLSNNLGIQENVYFMGYVEDELLPAYYLLSNLCVIPSITDGIGDPWVFIVNEAMYFGKPIIATDAVGAAFDMIKNGENGFIVPEKEVDSLYQSMRCVLMDDIVETKMGLESRRIIEEKYRYENMVEGFKEAIEWTLKNKRN